VLLNGRMFGIFPSMVTIDHLNEIWHVSVVQGFTLAHQIWPQSANGVRYRSPPGATHHWFTPSCHIWPLPLKGWVQDLPKIKNLVIYVVFAVLCQFLIPHGHQYISVWVKFGIIQYMIDPLSRAKFSCDRERASKAEKLLKIVSVFCCFFLCPGLSTLYQPSLNLASYTSHTNLEWM